MAAFRLTSGSEAASIESGGVVVESRVDMIRSRPVPAAWCGAQYKNSFRKKLKVAVWACVVTFYGLFSICLTLQ